MCYVGVVFYLLKLTSHAKNGRNQTLKKKPMKSCIFSDDVLSLKIIKLIIFG